MGQLQQNKKLFSSAKQVILLSSVGIMAALFQNCSSSKSSDSNSSGTVVSQVANQALLSNATLLARASFDNINRTWLRRGASNALPTGYAVIGTSSGYTNMIMAAAASNAVYLCNYTTQLLEFRERVVAGRTIVFGKFAIVSKERLLYSGSAGSAPCGIQEFTIRFTTSVQTSADESFLCLDTNLSDLNVKNNDECRNSPTGQSFYAGEKPLDFPARFAGGNGIIRYSFQGDQVTPDIVNIDFARLGINGSVGYIDINGINDINCGALSGLVGNFDDGYLVVADTQLISRVTQNSNQCNIFHGIWHYEGFPDVLRLTPVAGPALSLVSAATPNWILVPRRR